MLNWWTPIYRFKYAKMIHMVLTLEGHEGATISLNIIKQQLSIQLNILSWDIYK